MEKDQQSSKKHINYLTDFISVLKEELEEIDVPQAKIKEIKAYLETELLDYQSLQAIIDLTASINSDKENIKLRRLLNHLEF